MQCEERKARAAKEGGFCMLLLKNDQTSGSDMKYTSTCPKESHAEAKPECFFNIFSSPGAERCGDPSEEGLAPTRRCLRLL